MFLNVKHVGGDNREYGRRSFHSSSREGKLRLPSWYEYVEFDKREEGRAIASKRRENGRA